ncbi:MAG: dihydroorotate dehydrogenase [Longimicrobiales bacterium]
MNVTTEVFGVVFQNPVLLAAGTCGFGRELSDVLDIDAVGGFVTKSVTLEPRGGNPAPRVTEFGGGMMNSIGLANPGLAGTRAEKLPWIRDHVRRARVFVSVAGHSVEEFLALVEGLDGDDGFLGFELNLSCPNDTRRGGAPFALDPEAVAQVVSGARARTDRPLLAKLAPNDPDVARTAAVAEDAGADGLTLTNTLPGLLLDTAGAPRLGAGPGGVSGPALLPVGVRATSLARAATSIPLVGLGGISGAADAVAYARAGATLVGVGTATFADPRVGPRLAADLVRWGRRHRVAAWTDLVAPPPTPPHDRGRPADPPVEEPSWQA